MKKRLLYFLKVDVGGLIIGLFLKIIGSTYKINGDAFRDSFHFLTDKQMIVAFWHGQQLMMIEAFRRFNTLVPVKRNIHVLSSMHSDGQMIGRASRSFGLKTINGSSTRRGGLALLELMRVLERGDDIAITPDGPKGPTGSAKVGIVDLARKTQSLIVPIACAASNGWYANSWDRMCLPKPFSKVTIKIGKAISVDQTMSDDDIEIFAKGHLSEVLNTLTKEAEHEASL